MIAQSHQGRNWGARGPFSGKYQQAKAKTTVEPAVVQLFCYKQQYLFTLVKYYPLRW